MSGQSSKAQSHATPALLPSARARKPKANAHGARRHLRMCAHAERARKANGHRETEAAPTLAGTPASQAVQVWLGRLVG